MSRDADWERIDRLLQAALDLRGGERTAFLDRECPDPAIRVRLERMLGGISRVDDSLSPGGALDGSLGEAVLGRMAAEAPTLGADETGADGGGATAALPEDFSVGATVAGRYRLTAEAGRGGMGVVFRARDETLQRDVALKVVAGRLDRRWQERILREARAAAALNHTGVVAIHDVGEAAGLPFLVMEFVDGATLEDEPPRDLDEALAVARQVCDALGHAHAAGIVHRDLKPGNVLVVRRDGSLTAKLTDLGVALGQGDPRLTRTGRILGTPSYMAPEQALGTEIDSRADLYSLGVMLYRWSTGRLPFTGDNALAVVSQHIHAPVVPPRALRDDLPCGLDELILRLLAKEPQRRFATAEEVRAALDDVGVEGRAGGPVREVAALDGLVRGQLVGRETELEQLQQAWRAVLAGEGRLALIAGEPGAGKSRLARELTASVRLDGGLVLWGGCYEYEAATPYLPFVEALRRWVHERGEEELSAALGDSAAELARFAPEIESRLGPFADRPALSPNEERLRLFDHVARVLGRLAGRRGLALVLDDLQWADQGTLALLHYLARQLRGERVLFVGAYRADELRAGHPLTTAIEDWNRERLAVRINVDRLDADGTRQMLAALLGDATLPGDLAGSIHRETEGNPFFIEEVLKALLEEGQLVRDGGEWRRLDTGELVLPDSIRSTVARRLTRVGAGSLETLRVAALLGKRFRFDELVAVGDGGEDRVLDALDEAAAAQLLVTGEDDEFAFTHDKIREYLIAEINPVRRRRYHARIGGALATAREAGADVAPEDLALHFVAARDWERGLRWSREAAAAASALCAHDEALGHHERALDCARRIGSDAAVFEALLATAQTLDRKGESISAGECYERALEMAPTPEHEVTLCCRAAECYATVGDRRGLPFAERARDAADPERQPAESATALSTIARYHHYAGDSERAAELLLEAYELAERDGSVDTRLSVMLHLSGAYQHLLDFESSDLWARRVIELGERESAPLGVAGGLEFLSENTICRGLWREGLEYSRREIEVARRVQSAARMCWAIWCRAAAELGLGRLREARESLIGLRRIVAEVGELRLGLFGELYMVLVQANLGELDEALARVLPAVDEAERLGFAFHRGESLRALATARLRQGDVDGVVELLPRWEAVFADIDERNCQLFGRPVFAEALVRTGRLDDAARLVDDGLAAAATARSEHWEAMILAVRARLHAVRGEAGAARADADRAVELLERHDSAYDLAGALIVRAGLVAGEHGNADRRRADELFRRCGAPPPR